MRYTSTRTPQLYLRRISVSLFATSLLFGLLATGCQQSKEAETPVKSLAVDGQAKKNKAQGGGVDDMALYPAPAGQKTGIEGGKK